MMSAGPPSSSSLLLLPSSSSLLSLDCCFILSLDCCYILSLDCCNYYNGSTVLLLLYSFFFFAVSSLNSVLLRSFFLNSIISFEPRALVFSSLSLSLSLSLLLSLLLSPLSLSRLSLLLCHFPPSLHRVRALHLFLCMKRTDK